jgi:CDP-glucose 4,6-dehydratase
LKRHKIQTVFHLAAEAIVGNALLNPAEALDTNIRGTWTLLEAVRRANPKIQVIVASSDKAYGTHTKLPYTEEFPLQGENPYDVSKSSADLIANMYAKSYGLSICVTRCGNVYGGGDLNFSRLIPDMIRSFFQNKRPELRSDGEYRRDFIFVSDVVCRLSGSLMWYMQYRD